ncbi:hypothetical protein [Xanthobacter variabilis]|uniref:hypothetical protein n=1 Tax=Xanthobacter variabilis TaxID=3119932 RepID=UPI00374EF8F0
MTVTIESLTNGLPLDKNEALAAILSRVSKIDRGDHDDTRVAVLVIRGILKRIPEAQITEHDNDTWSGSLVAYMRDINTYLYHNKTESIEAEIDSKLNEWVDEVEGQTFGFASLSSSEKEKLIVHIERIRSIIESSEIRQSKKTKLYDRLTSLYNEILRDNTRTDSFFSFMGDLAFVAGEMAEKARPALLELKEVLRIVMRSRGKREGVSLPNEDDLPQLPATDQPEGD